MPTPVPFARYRETAVALLALAGLTLIVRAPFWAKAVMDWDESSFILMGQSILDGHLPYTHLWDIKPPVLFALFAGFIGALGRNIVSIRLGGALFVYATSVVIFLLASRFFDRASGIISAALYIVAASLFYGGQATYSEHLAVLPLVGSVAMLAACPYPGKSLLRSLALGACCCVSCFIRANLIIPGFVIGIMALIGTLRLGYRAAAYHIAACVLGAVVVFALITAPYVVSGHFDVFWDAVVVAPLAFQVSEGNLGHSPLGFLWNLCASSGFMAVYCGLTVVGFLWACSARYPEPPGTHIRVALVACSTAVSAILSGWAQPHYILQMLPLLAIYVGVGVRELLRRSRLAVLAAAVVGGVSLGPALQGLVGEARAAAERVAHGKGFVYGDAVDVVDYIRSLNLAEYSMFVTSDHIIYWMLDKPLLTKIAHPSNIFRPALVRVVYGSASTRASEIEEILQKRPTIVVINNIYNVMLGSVEGKNRLKSFLSSYVLVFCSGRLSVFIEAGRGIGCSSACRRPTLMGGLVRRLGGSWG